MKKNASKVSKPFAGIKKGALHDYLKMPQGAPIPSPVLHELANGSHPEHVRKMAQFALNARGFKKP